MKLKLLTAFLTLASLVSIANLIGIHTIQQLYSEFEETTGPQTSYYVKLEFLYKKLQSFEIKVLHHSLFPDSNWDIKKEIEVLQNEYLVWKVLFSSEKQFQKDEIFFDRLVSLFRDFFRNMEKVDPYHVSDLKYKPAFQKMHEQIKGILALLDEKIQILKSSLEKAHPQAKQNTLRAIMVHTITMILVIGLSLLLGIVVSNHLSAPLVKLKKAAQEVEKGNWNVHVESSSSDELGILAMSFNQMIRTLSLTTVSKEYVESILEAMLNSLILVDENGDIEKINRTVLDLLGYSEEELKGKKASLILEEEHFPFPNLSQEESFPIHEKNLITRDGKKIPLLFSSSSLSTQGGKKKILWVGQDLRERKELEKEVLEIKEMEQKRMGQDLHDGLGQLLTGIALLAKNLEKKTVSHKEEATRIVSLINEAISQTRNLARGLYPLEVETGNLEETLSHLVKYGEDLFSIQIHFSSHEFPLQNPFFVTHLYRIAQEAIHNAVRHGKARDIWISLEKEENKIKLSIEDNGSGFFLEKGKPESLGMGLKIMEYRARMINGNLEILSSSRGGVLIRCIVG